VLVGVVSGRSVDAVVAVLAVAVAGGGFVPVDPAYPRSRVEFMLADAGLDLVVCSSQTASVVPAGVRRLVLDDPETVARVAGRDGSRLSDSDRLGRVVPGDVAYVIYTSGSTGAPKGVVVTYAGLANLVVAQASRFGVGPGSRVLQFASLSFDAAVSELAVTLLSGAALVIADPTDLVAVVQRFGVTHVTVPPSVLAVLEDLPAVLGTVIVAGEACPVPVVQRWAQDRRLINAYGPTEATVCVSMTEPLPAGLAGGVVPIGRPIGNTRVWVLDEFLQPLPPGVVGDVYVAGVGLARGYLNQAGLTGSRFVACPFPANGGGERMYRTGDLARWTSGGELVFAGRADAQVKVRGHRVELGEVEAVLAGCPGVEQAVVLAREDRPTERRLVGYVTGSVTGEQVRGFAAERLPDYLLPAVVLVLDRLPVTPNGKIDRAGLPAPEYHSGGSRGPATAVEELLCGLYAEILGVEQVGVHDSFFQLGGDSLLAMRLVSRIRAVLDTEVSVRQLFAKPTVADMAGLLDGALAGDESAAGAARPRHALRAAPRPDVLPLSAGQQRMWFLNGLADAGTRAFHLPLTLRLSGDLDPAALEQAFGDVADRHESLRTVYPDKGGVPRQAILTGREGRPRLVVDRVAEADLEGVLAGELERPFDLARDLPWRIRLLELAPTEHVLVVVAHHIAVDGWSLGVLARDLSTAYAARSAGMPAQLPPLPVQYADYALWQHASLGEPTDPESLISQQVDFWREQLSDAPAELALPTDRPRPRSASFAGSWVPLQVSPYTHDRLVKLAQRQGVTTFMVVQAALAALLSRLGAGTDIPIGTPIAGRGDVQLEDLVGFFINTLVLRADVSGNPQFTELLTRVRATDLAAYGHQDVPFERLVEELSPERSLARHPLFQVMLTVDTLSTGRWGLAGLQTDVLPHSTDAARFDLSVSITERRDDTGSCAGIVGGIHYAVDLFDESTVRRLADRLARVLDQVAADVHIRVGQLEVLDPSERSAVTVGFNDTAAPAPDESIVSLFEKNVDRAPDAVAVRCGARVLTYRELDAWANHLAGRLRGAGIGAESRVGICLPRGVGWVVAVLGVWKAGGGYVPLDPEHPPQRLGHMLADSAATVVLGTAESLAGLPPGDAARMEMDSGAGARPGVPLHPRQLAYVIYTSGSTGRPKGVAVPHSGLVNLATALRPVLGIEPGVTMLQFASFSFDAAVLDLVVALAGGGTLAIASTEERAEPRALTKMINESGVRAASVVPSLLGTLNPAEVAGVRTWYLGAERMSADLADRWATDRALWNSYGPTEATVIATDGKVSPDPDGRVRAAPPVGRPIANTRIYVLDDFLLPVPVGVTGEVYIAGPGLARGYVGQPVQTATRFVACPYPTDAADPRMYRSGDLARWTADGELDFVGRADDQVKIRGFRIEPGEAEAVLAAHPSVAQVAVVVREDRADDKRLVAYVVAAPAVEVDQEALRAFAALSLPDYLVPAAVVAMDALPLTVNGKLDRNRLPAPEVNAAAGRGPETPVEELFCRLYAEVLGLPEVGAEDSFFALGGDSIMSMQLASRVREAGFRITAQAVFEHRTPAGLAAVAEPISVPDAALALDDAVGEVPLTPAMLALAASAGPAALDGRLFQSMTLQAPAGLDVERLIGALHALAVRHDVLRARLVRTGEEPAGWTLSIPPPPETPAKDWVRRVAAAGLAGAALDELIGGELRAAVDRLDPAAGVMFQAVWCDVGPDRPGRLLLVAHHLVVDGVSWRILLPDLAAAYAAGPDVLLASVPTPFRHWARALAAQATSAEREAELPAWVDLLAAPVGRIGPRSLDPARDIATAMGRVAVTVPADITGDLLTRVPTAFNAGVDEVLLAALALAVAQWRRRLGDYRAEAILVDLEGHGREPLTDGMDLSRTVGWFTKVYPVRVHVGAVDFTDVRAGGPSGGRVVKRVKEQLRAVPADGLGHGLLRHLNLKAAPELAALPVPEIGFNYLGRIAAQPATVSDVDENPAAGDWRPIGPDAFGGGADPRMAVSHVLEAAGLVADGPGGAELILSFTWPSRLLTEAAVSELAADWRAMLAGLAAHAARPDSGGNTPSDFALVDLAQHDIDELELEFMDER
jgi:amino acid adenylation domain-containing protein/non-ribosomal peptide synthase protein (TIGR01720 family)